jgi:hypothetical protein
MWSWRGRLATSLLLLPACAEESWLGRSDEALAIEGPWRIPEATLALGDAQYVAYEGGGPWLGEEGCSGSLLPGTRLVGDYVAQRFMQVSLVGGYNCRPIRGGSDIMSLHGAGRAVDLHVPTIGEAGDADNDLGDEIGHFLIEHAELLGVQLIIWDQYSWGASRAEGEKGRDYTGVNPHHDHLHVELSVSAASREEDWFSAALEAAEGEPDAGVVVPGDADAGLEADAGTSGPAPQEPDKPREVRPVIKPVLDDDPMIHGDGSSQHEGPVLRGQSCSVRPGASRGASAWLLLLAGALWLGTTRLRARLTKAFKP